MGELKLFENDVFDDYYIAMEVQDDLLEEVEPQDYPHSKFHNLLEDLNQVNFSKFEICHVDKILSLYDSREFNNILEKLKNFKPICDFNKNIIIVENMTFEIHDLGLVLVEIEDKFYKTENGDKIINSLDEKDVDLIKKLCGPACFRYTSGGFWLYTVGCQFGGTLDIEYLTNPIFKNIYKFEDCVHENCKILNMEEPWCQVEFENKKYTVYNDGDETLSDFAVSQIINDYLQNKGKPLFNESGLIEIYDKMNIPDEQRKFFKNNNLEEDFFDGIYNKCFKEYYVNKYDLNCENLMRSSDSPINPFKNPDSSEYIDFNREINDLKGEWKDLIVGEPYELGVLDEYQYYDLCFGTNTSEEDIRFLFGKDKNTGITFLLRTVGWGWGPGMYD